MSDHTKWQSIANAPFESAKRFLLCHHNGIAFIGFRIHEDGPWVGLHCGIRLTEYPPHYWMELPNAPEQAMSHHEENQRFHDEIGRMHAENEFNDLQKISSLEKENCEMQAEIERLRADNERLRTALRAVDDYFTKGLIDVLPITMVQEALAAEDKP